jgi:hypothetical protein
MEMNQGYVYFAKFTLTLFMLNEKKFCSPVFKPVDPLLFLFFCFVYLLIKTGTRISVEEISQVRHAHIRDLPPTRCTNIKRSIMQKEKTNSFRMDWLNQAKPHLNPLTPSFIMMVFAINPSTPPKF